MRKYSIFIIIFLFSYLFPNNLIDNFINGKISITDINLESENLNQYQNSLIKGLSDVDGDRAKDYLEDYYNSDDDLYDDIASIKIAEYYYSLGSYLKSSDWYKKVALDFPNSNYSDIAKSYYLNSLVIIGEKDSANFYSQKFKKKKKLNFDDTFFKRKNKNNFSKNVSQDQYSVQIGSFTSYQAAKKMRKVLSSEGFLCRIDEVQRGYKTFYSVRIGNFKNKSLATKEQKRLKYRIGIYDSIIIKLN